MTTDLDQIGLSNAESPSRASTAHNGVAPDLLARAVLIRGVEQRLLSLFAEGKLFGTVHTCIGQEWTGIAVAEALIDGDIIFTNHRGHGHFLARTGDVEGLIAEVMGKQAGVCGGRGGSQHLCAGAFTAMAFRGVSYRSRPGWRWRRSSAAATGSPWRSSATARWERERSTRR